VLTVYGSTLDAGDSFTFDGSAEADGSFRLYGGLGADNLTGGAGNDGFYFGRDGRFDPLTDHVDGGAGINDQLALDSSYTVAISGANVTNVEVLLNAASLDSDLAAALAGLNANHAVQFTTDSGTLAGHIFEVIDTNGIAGYQAGQDMVIELQTPVNPITDATAFV
jgi:Ca2+-binding RTX toxin-like protein